MKTEKQKLNAAKKKLNKIFTDLEALSERLVMIAEDFDDDGFSDLANDVCDAISDIAEGNAKASLPELQDYLENYNIDDYEE